MNSLPFDIYVSIVFGNHVNLSVSGQDNNASRYVTQPKYSQKFWVVITTYAPGSKHICQVPYWLCEIMHAAMDRLAIL